MVVEIVELILVIVLAAISQYVAVKKNLTSNITKMISEVEDKYADLSKVGLKKMNEAVDILYDKYVPVFFRPLITKDKIREEIQNTWEYVESYAKNQKDKYVQEAMDKIEETVDKIEEAGEAAKEQLADMAEDAVEEVKKYTEEMLEKLLKADVAEIAGKLGLTFKPKTTKAEMIGAILDAQSNDCSPE